MILKFKKEEIKRKEPRGKTLSSRRMSELGLGELNDRLSHLEGRNFI
jgi:hypothetical protein